MIIQDPYGILGVERDASEAEIRAAYVRLAKTCHPDLHPDDPEAEERFKLIAAARDILADPDRREQFDRESLARIAPRTPRFGGFPRKPAPPPPRPAPKTAPADEQMDEDAAFGALFFNLFGPFRTRA